MSSASRREPHISATGLAVGYGSNVIQRDLDFIVHRADVFVVMGGSGSGKSTVMRTLMGLVPPLGGTVRIDGRDLYALAEAERTLLQRRFGVMYQQGALWSAMTLEENVALPLELFTPLDPAEIGEIARLKLALVGLEDAAGKLPAEISGGMRKRAAIARALALDPEILFLDEPSAGLDPVSARRLDDLILELRDALGTTVVVVTHELASIFAIADDSVFLDAETRTMIAQGRPSELVARSGDPRVVAFLTRGERMAPAGMVGPAGERA
jgi:phospholipid/cholesterol/gamma-HCH transport system ATP-binding protein